MRDSSSWAHQRSDLRSRFPAPGRSRDRTVKPGLTTMRLTEVLIHVALLPVYVIGILYLNLHNLWVNR